MAEKQMEDFDSAVVKPIRVQLRRTKGWKMPPNTVRVCRPGLFGNPWTVEECGAHDAVAAYRRWLTGAPWEDKAQEERRQRVLKAIPTLRGKNLACWCKLNSWPCHADVLLELASGDAP